MKAKRILAGIVAGVMTLSISALPAMAVPVISPYPEKDASVSLNVANVLDENDECGSIEILDSSVGFQNEGDFYKLEAVPNEGYLFDHWEYNLIFEMKDGSFVDKGSDYCYMIDEDRPNYAFTNVFEQAQHDPLDSQLNVNRVVPPEMADIDVIHYDITAYFSDDNGDTYPLIVNYLYKGNSVSGRSMMKYLPEGENKIDFDADYAGQFGFKLKDGASAEQTVTVTRDKDGKLISDVESVQFEVVPTVDPTTVSFAVSYVDTNGNTLPGGDLYFDDIGRFSSENIPLPYGYMAVIPAHPGEDYLYPTSLLFVDGEWQAVPPSVEILVEKAASVSIRFELEDGTLLEDESFERYYKEIGAGIETVEAPYGYEIIGENTYAVEITRDENGNLVADPSEVTFKVRPVNSSSASGTESSSAGSTASSGKNPSTGDHAPMALAALVVLSALGAGITFKKRVS